MDDRKKIAGWTLTYVYADMSVDDIEWPDLLFPSAQAAKDAAQSEVGRTGTEDDETPVVLEWSEEDGRFEAHVGLGDFYRVWPMRVA